MTLTRQELRKIKDEKIQAIVDKYIPLFEPYEQEILKLRGKLNAEREEVMSWYKEELSKLN